jgi:hypothetical protein
MTVRELLKEILVSGCSLDDRLCLVTKFEYSQAHHEIPEEEDEALDNGPQAKHLMRAMSHPDHVDTTRENEGVLIMEFGYDK